MRLLFVSGFNDAFQSEWRGGRKGWPSCVGGGAFPKPRLQWCLETPRLIPWPLDPLTPPTHFCRDPGHADDQGHSIHMPPSHSHFLPTLYAEILEMQVTKGIALSDIVQEVHP